MGIIETLEAIAYVIACYAFGRVCMIGFRKKLNFLLDLLLSFVLGFIAISISPIFKSLVPFDVFLITDVITSLIASSIIALCLFLITSGFVEKPITRKDLKKIMEELEILKEEVKRIKEVLAEKKILAEKLAREKILKKLGDALKEKKIKEFQILKEVEGVNEWEFLIKSDKKRYLAKVDAYSGELLSLSEKESEILEKLKLLAKNKVALIGIVLLVVFLVALPIIYWGEIGKNLLSQFKLMGIVKEECNESCLSMSCLISFRENNKIRDEDITLAYLEAQKEEVISEAIEAINSTKNDDAIILASVNYKNTTYLIVISLTSEQKIEFMNMVLTKGLPGLLNYIIKHLQELKDMEVCSLASGANGLEKCSCESLPEIFPRLLPIIQGKLAKLA